MSSSGRARSMKAWRLERKTRKRWSRRMSTDAGWTHFGSNGSIPMRPASIAARISRSERTTATEYAGLRPAQCAHRVAELAPRAHGPVGIGQRRPREAPQHLDGVRACRLAHRKIRSAVADHDRFVRRDAETAHGVLREVRGRLRPWHRIAPEINVDILLYPETAQDPLAVSGPLAGDRRLPQPGGVEIAQRCPRSAIETGCGDRHGVVPSAVFDAKALDIRRPDIRPRQPKHGVERKASELAYLLVRKQGAAVRGDDRVHRLDDQAHAVGERAVQIPQDRSERRSLSGDDGARARR